jgi:Fe-S-cluster-containing dehydrogenase component/DMSO reductase anchor subunit
VTLSFVQQLLQEQQELSGVDEFALSFGHLQPARTAQRYSRLLPAAPPGPGEQYAFEVDLDRCSGCKACVTACHSLNGLESRETWREVGLLVGGTSAQPYLQHVTAACHHCLEPACLTSCPVNAYQKDPVTGIVRHLDDQCFGCQYCTLACPYDVPKYNRAKGIVRKCDMCATRLAAAEAPACVEGCPHDAISIRVVAASQVRADAETGQFLPAAPRPDLTYPTTTYRTRRVFPRDTLPVDYHSVTPQHPHWPLVVMLVLTQLSVGGFLVGSGMEFWLDPALVHRLVPWHAALSLGFGLLALAASVFHLGRPRFAYRAVLGLRHSWLSREIVAFGLFSVLAASYSGWTWLAGSQMLDDAVANANDATSVVRRIAAALVAIAGLAGVFSSAMIYAATQREFWNLPRSLARFWLTMVILGPAACWLSLAAAAVMNTGISFRESAREVGGVLCSTLVAAMAIKLTAEAAVFRHLLGRRSTSMKRSARLMKGELSKIVLARFSCGLLGGIVMPGLLHDVVLASGRDGNSAMLKVIAVAILFISCLIGELLERYLFFAAVAVPRMPMGLRP